MMPYPSRLESVDTQGELETLRARVRELESELTAQGENLQASSHAARIEDFATASSGWFWEMDHNYRFTYFSRSVEDITGVPPEWHYGKTREEIGTAASVDRETWETHIAQLRRREPFSKYVFRRTGPDGVKWMQTSGVPVFDAQGCFAGYRGTAIDVTQQVEAQRRSDLLMAAVENLSESFVLWDADDRLAVSNARFREVNTAVSDASQPGTPFEVHVRAALEAGEYPEAAGREEEWFNERMALHRHSDGPFEVARQDGVWLLVCEHHLPDGCTATLSANISERKRAELELEHHKESLERTVSERTAHLEAANEEIKRFSYIVSHDLRAPLVSITGFAGELERDCQEALQVLRSEAGQLKREAGGRLQILLGESVPEALGFIKAATTRMDRQISALLDYSRLGARELMPTSVDLEKLVSGCLDSIAHQVEQAGVEVIVEPLPALVSDTLAVEQILGNLLDNAVKFLDPDRPGRIAVRGAPSKSTVTLEVADNGIGVPERDRESIFQVFTRASSPAVSGTGMGLAQVQALARRLGGRAWCEPAVNEGTTFYVELASQLHAGNSFVATAKGRGGNRPQNRNGPIDEHPT